MFQFSGHILGACLIDSAIPNPVPAIEIVQSRQVRAYIQDLTLFVCVIIALAATFPSGPATEQTLDVRFRTTATWIFAIAQFLVVRDNWGDTQQVLLSQGKWKLSIDAPASDLLLVCSVKCHRYSL